ncbi:hypothetical protein G7Y89_g4904 [Cudoniella acicularis]|uniref:Uncharacterized protein n=1 Tax=Cudoniella acicularis TaxID=354080 RepID=A0A8H4W4I1_9HELO|nr:hypothetical protein G7Y89_g4904 [Cudoniella acicularis]
MLTEAAEILNMFNGNFAEANNMSGEFPKDDPAAQELLVQWCYTGAPRAKKTKWRTYIYTNMTESSGMRNFMATSFDDVVTYSRPYNDLNASQYSFDAMHDFANQYPDLLRDYFLTMRFQEVLMGNA